MKQHYLILCFLSLSVTAQSQKIEYAYDYAGNRISRTVVVLPPSQVKKHTDDTIPPKPVEEKLGIRTIKIYPNPTKGMLAVEIMGGDENDAIEIQLISGQGIRLQTLKPATEKTPVDMRNYPTGWYILRIVAGKEIKEMKIVKQ